MNDENKIVDIELLTKYIGGNANQEEIQMVQDWLIESELNQVQFDQLLLTWDNSAKVTPSLVAVDVDAVWNRMSTQIDEELNPAINQKSEQQ